jgi:hypothetical protein
VPIPVLADLSAPRRRLVGLAVVAVLVLAGAVVVDAVRPSGRPAAPPGSWTMVPHEGLGAWVDVYDWTVELGGPVPDVDVDDIDAMAKAGIQTLYLQTSSSRSSDDVMEPEQLDALIDRAHANHLHVVAWYLPTFVDPARDLRRLVEASKLRVDGLAVDIESTDLADLAERNRRVVELSSRLRAAVGGRKALAAITLSSVHQQAVNPAFWPAYPWAELAATYDLLMPMSYWSIRTGDLRNGARYVGEDIDRVRALVGDEIPIHAIGGIADGVSVADLGGMVAAIRERGAIGGSLYDWNTSTPEQWAALRPLRREDP